VFPLQDAKTKQLRVIVINKNQYKAATVELHVGGPALYKQAQVIRLVATGANPLGARSNVTLGGVRFEPLGSETAGQPTSQWVYNRVSKGSTHYKVYMPPGSAALLQAYPA